MANPNLQPNPELDNIIELAIDGLKLALTEKRLSLKEVLEQALVLKEYQDAIQT